jgi:hypothetical protein
MISIFTLIRLHQRLYFYYLLIIDILDKNTVLIIRYSSLPVFCQQTSRCLFSQRRLNQLWFSHVITRKLSGIFSFKCISKALWELSLIVYFILSSCFMQTAFTFGHLLSSASIVIKKP